LHCSSRRADIEAFSDAEQAEYDRLHERLAPVLDRHSRFTALLLREHDLKLTDEEARELDELKSWFPDPLGELTRAIARRRSRGMRSGDQEV
jgi:hypothetical protein